MTKAETLTSLVGPNVLQYGEMGHIHHKGDVVYYVYTGFSGSIGGTDKGLHIIIGERHVGIGNKLRRIWYFGTFEGPEFLYMTAEDRQKYDQVVLETLDNKNRVPGRKLEPLIREAQMAFWKK